MAHKSIQDELLAATGQKPPKKGEARQDFLKRIFKAVQELSDEEWKELSKAAGGWSNEASPAFDGDKELPEFPDVAEAKSEPKADKAKGKAKAKEAEDPAADSEDDPGNGAEDEDSAEEEEAPEAESEDTTVKKPSKKADKAKDKPAAKEKAPAKDKPKTKAPAKKRGSGGVQAVMAHVLKHPDDSVEDIIKALKSDGLVLTPSTVSSARGFFKLVVRFLQDKKLTSKVIFKD